MNHTATAGRFCSTRGRWSALTIVLMIIGFAVWWPLGLAMLAYNVWGEQISRRTGEVRDQFRGWRGRGPFRAGGFDAGVFGNTGNVAFDEYRNRELRRLDEERRKIDEMRAEFDTFLRELRRVKDQEEFDRFMADFRNRTSGVGGEQTA